jgi:hypothetical protein
MVSPTRPAWPDGARFAFTVFDDTDRATIENVAGVYEFLEEIGMRTTKSVWPISIPGSPLVRGATCDDPEYAAWTVDLQHRGFEIGYHGASNVTATRTDVARALDRFRSLYGHTPAVMANHADCQEGMYWGEGRVSGMNRLAYNLLTRFKRVGRYRGHVEGDPLFWGDLCRDQVRYVRNFTFRGIDTLGECAVMPYHDPDRPYVNGWFASSEGRDVGTFNACLSEEAQDRLEASGGACIMYTHFAAGFWDGGRLHERFEQLMRRLAARKGWFVPVSTLLDHLAGAGGPAPIGRAQRNALERRWLRSKTVIGST